MKVSYGLIVVIAFLRLSHGVKKSAFGSLPWEGFPFIRPPTESEVLKQISPNYYEYYVLGEDLDDIVEEDNENEAKTKPDVKPSNAFHKEISISLHDFTFDLLRAIAQNKTSENLVISPLSIYTALSMLTLGLNGTSKAQALTAMHSENLQDIHKEMKELSEALFTKERENVTLTVANRIFVDRTIQLYKTFKRNMKRNYQVSAKKVDFVRDPETNRRRINNFVLRHTNGKIRNLAPPGSVDMTTRLFLVNAMYMKAFWQFPFHETPSKAFHVSPEETISVKTMTSGGYCTATTDNELGARIVRNQLKGDLSMVMIIPDLAGDFSKLEDLAGKKKARRALETLYDSEVTWKSYCQIKMPKFKINYRPEDLIEKMKTLGFEDIFDSKNCDLSGMTPRYSGLHVTDMQHRATIDVNEGGIEGAAATSIGVMIRSMPMPVTINRPFMFIVRDDITGATLFTGKVVRPNYS